MWATMKSWETQFPSNENFSPFLQLNFSSFRLVQCERHQNTRKDLGQVTIKNMFPETIIYKIFETYPNFHEKYCTTSKV